jgi:hypothetical protein
MARAHGDGPQAAVEWSEGGVRERASERYESRSMAANLKRTAEGQWQLAVDAANGGMQSTKAVVV